jgi:hypothetical protein
MEDLPFGESPLNINPRPAKRFPSRFFTLVIVVIVLALVVFGISKVFFANQNTGKKETLITPTITMAPTNPPEATKAAQATPTKGVNKTPTPTPVAGSATIDKTKVSIGIQNGSGEVGVASKMATYLKGLGYKIGSTGNADNYDYEGVTVQTKAEFKNYIATLKKDLASEYTVTSATSDLPSTSTPDILVIVGK